MPGRAAWPGNSTTGSISPLGLRLLDPHEITAQPVLAAKIEQRVNSLLPAYVLASTFRLSARKLEQPVSACGCVFWLEGCGICRGSACNCRRSQTNAAAESRSAKSSCSAKSLEIDRTQRRRASVEGDRARWLGSFGSGGRPGLQHQTRPNGAQGRSMAPAVWASARQAAASGMPAAAKMLHRRRIANAASQDRSASRRRHPVATSCCALLHAPAQAVRSVRPATVRQAARFRCGWRPSRSARPVPPGSRAASASNDNRPVLRPADAASARP